MPKIVRENLNEAKLNLPKDYLNKVRQNAGERYGTTGPSRADFQRMGELINRIFSIQRGHEDELTEIGKEVIQKFYGPVIEGVELDVKIVDPEDEEKMEMAQKMLQQPQQQEQNQGDSPEFETNTNLEGIEDDIDKRKLINNIMQGEAQNVHDMMYDVRDKVEEVTGSSELLNLYMEFLEINKKFDWEDRFNLEEMMRQAPQMANAMETEWEEGGEGEDDTPKIKARVLDLPMLIHETVKGIYELIAAGAVDPDPVRAQKVLNATDSLTDEKEDIKYGPYIARDIRNYVNKVADSIFGANDIPNLREYVFGKMIEMPSKQFVDFVTNILEDNDKAEITLQKIIKDILYDFEEYNKAKMQSQFDDDLNYEEMSDDPNEENDLINFMNKPSSKSTTQEIEPQETKKPNYRNMGQAELNYYLNQAIDSDDWDTAKEIQQYLKLK